MMRLLMNSPGTDQAPPPGSRPCRGRRGILQTMTCDHALDDKGKHDMICETGGFTESRHNKVRDWLGNNIREREGATVSMGREVGPFRQAERENGHDFQRREKPIIRVSRRRDPDWMGAKRRRSRSPTGRPTEKPEDHRKRTKTNNIWERDDFCNKATRGR